MGLFGGLKEKKEVNMELYHAICFHLENIKIAKTDETKLEHYDKLIPLLSSANSSIGTAKLLSGSQYVRSFLGNHDLRLVASGGKSIVMVLEDKYKSEYKKLKYIAYQQSIVDKFFSTVNKHQIFLNTSLRPKQSISNMPEIKFTNITKNFNKDRLLKYVVLDLETTGLSATSAEIIEVSAIKYEEFEPVEYFSTLIKPKKEISKEITAINGITNEMVNNAPAWNEVVDSLYTFIDGYDLVGHNLIFDLKFLYVKGIDLFENNKKRKFYDTLELSRKAWKDFENYKLDTICHELNIYRPQNHRALYDSMATNIVFQEAISYLCE